MIVELKEMENGDLFLEIPPEILKKMDWKEGDDITIESCDNGFNGFITLKKVD